MDLIGKRVKCISMKDDPNPIESGEEGVVQLVDGIGQLHIKWDNGGSLALIPNVDEYEILN